MVFRTNSDIRTLSGHLQSFLIVEVWNYIYPSILFGHFDYLTLHQPRYIFTLIFDAQSSYLGLVVVVVSQLRYILGMIYDLPLAFRMSRF